MPDNEQELRDEVIAAFDKYANASQGACCTDKELAEINRAVGSLIYLIDSKRLA